MTCCFSMLHPMQFLLFLQEHYLWAKHSFHFVEDGGKIQMWTTQIEFSERCVNPQCFTQRSCSFFSNDVVCVIQTKKNDLLMDIFCVWCLLCLPVRFSLVIVLLIFNASLSVVASLFLRQLPVELSLIFPVIVFDCWCVEW